MRKILSKLTTAALATAGLVAGSFNASAQSTPLINWLDTWEYNDATTPEANLHGNDDWKQLNYDTSTVPGWTTGEALFGNDGAGLYDGPGRPFAGRGLNGFTTPLNRAIAAASDRVTFYFRKKFTYTGPTAGIILDTSWVHDDGFVVYLNGVEILRNKMTVAAPDPVTWDTLGQNHDAAGTTLVAEGFEWTQDIISTPLVEGENVIAVELHQSSTTSSDCSFALNMNAVIPFAPTITDDTQPTNRIVLQNRSTTLTVLANASKPISYQWFFQPAGGGAFSAIPDATNATYEIASMQETDGGDYYCSISNPVGSVDSRVATVTYTTDGTPPTPVRVRQGSGFDTVIVEFNEAVTQVTAENPFSYFANDGVNPQIDPIGVTLNADGRSVTVVYLSPLLPDTLYSVGVDSVSDLANNFMPAEVQVSFRTWVPTDFGGVLFEAFDTADAPGGNSVASLIAHPNYPNNPRETYRLNAFSTRAAPVNGDPAPYPDDTHEQYGGRLRALFIPPTSGNWKLYLSSDDSSELYFNPTGPGTNGKVLVQQEGGCCNPYSAHPTLPFALEANHAYYIEALYKEGTGGDYLHVWAGLEGEVPPAATAASLTALDAIQGNMLGAPAAPANVAGTFTITQQPTDQFGVPNSTVTFSVGTDTDTLLGYEWSINGVPIPNANGPQYTRTVTPADNGALVNVKISILAGISITSADATLTVGADTIRPTVLSVVGNAGGTTLTVTYSEAMGASAADAANYTVNGVAASSAVLNAAGTVATVTPATPLASGGCTISTVSISGVSDQATSPNLVDPNPTTVSLSSPLAVLLPMNSVWKYDDTATDLGTAWRETGFDDNAWLSGPAPLGSEPGTPQVPVVATPISASTATNTAYFRTHFDVNIDPGTIVVLQLSEIIDDGGVYYLNGVELHRSYMEAAPAVIGFSTLATGGGPEPTDGTHTVVSVSVPKTALVAGDNVLAVELHPSSVTSSDSEFAAQLSAVLCLPTLTIEHVGSQVRLTWSDAAYRLETAPAPDGPWSAQAGGSGVMLPSDAGNLFVRLVSP